MKKFVYIILFAPLTLLGQVNYSLGFDGIDDYISIPESFFDGQFTQDFTLECWAKTGNTSWNSRIWGKTNYPINSSFS